MVGCTTRAGLAVGGFRWRGAGAPTPLPGGPGPLTAAFDDDTRGRIAAAARTGPDDRHPVAVLLVPR